MSDVSEELWRRYQAQPVELQRRIAYSIVPALWGAMQALSLCGAECTSIWRSIRITIESIEQSERWRQQQKESNHG